jgi:hypothetical protein
VTKSVGIVALSADYEVGVSQLRDAAANVLNEAHALGGNRSVLRAVPNPPELLTG